MLFTCTLDNPLTEGRGLSPCTCGHTMAQLIYIYWSHTARRMNMMTDTDLYACMRPKSNSDKRTVESRRFKVLGTRDFISNNQ